ncbi:hypothetical protein BABINDRAFT_167670 [Babjeviella inositovora NRRL Y-12698]|uniref:Uncharacterized protein n=1 Tax=Babjeviella inositovora NRRL Y-12698 TaxID=984486 RepID=A0A1E3QNW2_9ASCO|nr:uncharacterized protein BABINDRAFT_167670 [Babjeviella inositovora NRRL Y-12698]ODQ79134.1 hypothetical protein BABINDRAFT_167670 [Babjeviella inositovora NRRL Y-12698]
MTQTAIDLSTGSLGAPWPLSYVPLLVEIAIYRSSTVRRMLFYRRNDIIVRLSICLRIGQIATSEKIWTIPASIRPKSARQVGISAEYQQEAPKDPVMAYPARNPITMQGVVFCNPTMRKCLKIFKHISPRTCRRHAWAAHAYLETVIARLLSHQSLGAVAFPNMLPIGKDNTSYLSGPQATGGHSQHRGLRENARHGRQPPLCSF